MRMSLFVLAAAIASTMLPVQANSGPRQKPWPMPEPKPYQLDAATLTAARRAVQKAVDNLVQTQNADGSWGKAPHPAIAALCAMALHGAPASDPKAAAAAVDKAMTFVLKFRQPDGSIYPAGTDPKDSGNYPNYSTSIALLALAAINKPEYTPAMQAARRYVQQAQFADPATLDYGGMGYGKTGRADLSNGSWAAEALHFTDYLDEEPFTKDREAAQRRAAMWEKFGVFLTKVQNLPQTNQEAYVSSHPDDLGGFVYRPTESKAGSRDGDGQTSSLISSGSMTYAGLKSMLYAHLSKEDPRVRGALDYLRRHYTLAENPGMGSQGLYYYLHIMTKALEAYGADTLTTPDGVAHDWRREVLGELLKLQQANGTWVNANGRYMESLPELATAYSLIAVRLTIGEFPLRR